MKNNKIRYGNTSKSKTTKFTGGRKSVQFSKWGHLKVTGTVFEFGKETEYKHWGLPKVENVCLIEGGKGIVELGNKRYEVKDGDTLKIFPGQEPRIIPKKKLRLFSIQMPTTRTKFPGENLNTIKVRRSKQIPSMVYEYEALGQEYYTPKYKKGLGLIRFIFPINNIPLHIHPNADRLIRPMAGVGFTYAQPKRFNMNKNTFCLFPKGTKHTNGPNAGYVYDLWAVQLPWVESKVTKTNIAGDRKFVRYVETVPPKALWKTKEGLQEAVRKLDRG